MTLMTDVNVWGVSAGQDTEYRQLVDRYGMLWKQSYSVEFNHNKEADCEF